MSYVTQQCFICLLSQKYSTRIAILFYDKNTLIKCTYFPCLYQRRPIKLQVSTSKGVGALNTPLVRAASVFILLMNRIKKYRDGLASNRVILVSSFANIGLLLSIYSHVCIWMRGQGNTRGSVRGLPASGFWIDPLANALNCQFELVTRDTSFKRMSV
jgi:hypothetical protein